MAGYFIYNKNKLAVAKNLHFANQTVYTYLNQYLTDDIDKKWLRTSSISYYNNKVKIIDFFNLFVSGWPLTKLEEEFHIPIETMKSAIFDYTGVTVE